jgi:hypothetical protein
MRGDVVVDGRNALDAALLGRLGFRNRGFGRATDVHGWAVQATRSVDVVG